MSAYRKARSKNNRNTTNCNCMRRHTRSAPDAATFDGLCQKVCHRQLTYRNSLSNLALATRSTTQETQPVTSDKDDTSTTFCSATTPTEQNFPKEATADDFTAARRERSCGRSERPRYKAKSYEFRKRRTKR